MCRFIGADLFRITPNFRAVVQKVADDLTFGHFTYNEVIIRPGVQQPVYGPDGINGSREAYAPTPGRGKLPAAQWGCYIHDLTDARAPRIEHHHLFSVLGQVR